MNALITKVIIEVGKALGKAVVAGVGVELARVASAHIQRRLGPKKDDPKAAPEKTPEELRRENEELRREVERLREQVGAVVVPPDLAGADS